MVIAQTLIDIVLTLIDTKSYCVTLNYIVLTLNDIVQTAIDIFLLIDVVQNVPLGGDGVDLINKDDSRAVLLSQTEHVTHHARALAQILLHEL